VSSSEKNGLRSLTEAPCLFSLWRKRSFETFAICRSKRLLSRLSGDERLRDVLPGFSGYFLVEPANGVLTSISLFETSSQLDESNRVAEKIVQEENLETVMPNSPKIISGELIAHKEARVRRRLTASNRT
jgi:hypothetical protein